MPTSPSPLPVADAIVSADDMQLQVDGQMVDWAAFWAQYDADYEVQPLLRAPLSWAACHAATAGGRL